MSKLVPQFISKFNNVCELNESLRLKDGIMYSKFIEYLSDKPYVISMVDNTREHGNKTKVKFTFDFKNKQIKSDGYTIHVVDFQNYRLVMGDVKIDFSNESLVLSSLPERLGPNTVVTINRLLYIYNAIYSRVNAISVINQAYLENLERICDSVDLRKSMEYFNVPPDFPNVEDIDSDTLNISDVIDSIRSDITNTMNVIKNIVYNNTDVRIPHHEISIIQPQSRHYNATDGYGNYAHISSLVGISPSPVAEVFFDENKNILVVGGSCFKDIPIYKLDDIRWPFLTAIASNEEKSALELVYLNFNKAILKMYDIIRPVDGGSWLNMEFQYCLFINCLSELLKDEG